jgi:hypothetical protein
MPGFQRGQFPFARELQTDKVAAEYGRDQVNLMKSIEESIYISSDRQTVWNTITTFEDYQSWNPFIVNGSGTAEVGERLDLVMQVKPGSQFKVRPVVLASTGTELRWLGKFLVSGLFDGEHYFIIEEVQDGVTLRQGEKFRGILVPFMSSLLESTRRNFVKMNMALKAHCEAKSGGSHLKQQ